MARIAGIDLPNKSAKIALTYIYGIGRTSAVKICEATGIDADKKINDLTPEEVNNLRKVIETEYRKGLPVRGQRTKTNARTRKGKKKTVAGKKK